MADPVREVTTSGEGGEEKVCGICMDTGAIAGRDTDSQPLAIDGRRKRLLCCHVCHNAFCERCVLYWKITKDECPTRCSRPWDIDVPPLPDRSIHLSSEPAPATSDDANYQSEEDVWDGFIKCPRCARLGCLLCSNISCRIRITFEPVLLNAATAATLPLCATCPDNMRLELYQSTNHFHPPCTHTTELYYLFCAACQRKYCC